MSYEEAAAVIGCAVGTVRSRLSRARDELQTALASDKAPRNSKRERGKGTAEFLGLLNAA